jgi:hypothetical protein
MPGNPRFLRASSARVATVSDALHSVFNVD